MYCVFFLLVVIASALAVNPPCGPNEVYKTCGPACHPTCAQPDISTIACPKPCVRGCFCQDGYLQNSKGKCVAKVKCGIHEVYNPCVSPCPLTCGNVHNPPHCSPGIVCQEGCECKEGYVLNKGVCVPVASCPGLHCFRNRTYQVGNIHVTTCDNVDLQPVKPGCYCEYGYFLNRHNGRCVLEQDCPKELECTFRNEKLSHCRPPCPKTCRDPQPHPCHHIGPCRGGCVCKDGYVRDTENGNCVREGNCPDQKCYGYHEIFEDCGSHCPPICGEPPKPCILLCERGCFCEPGFIREHDGGQCISHEECTRRIRG
ncbi:hypothetical protein Trydic_g14605 [Trypoxylus dichotomus]